MTENEYRTKTLTDAHNNYIERIPDGIEWKKAKVIFEAIIEQIWFQMIQNKVNIRLPFGLGNYMIVEKKREEKVARYINWKKSKETGTKQYGYNLKSCGFRHRVHWSKCLCKVKNHKLYRIKFFRGSRESLIGYRGLGGWIDLLDSNPEEGCYRSNMKPHC